MSTQSATPLTVAHYLTIFDKNALLSKEFSPDEFISECQRRVGHPLSELEQFSKAADSELIELINKEYSQFLRLSTDLAGLEPLFDRMEGTLKQLNNEANGAWHKLSNDYAEIERLLADRRALTEKRAALELRSSLEAAVSKVEALLQQEQDLRSMKLDDSSLSNTIERVTNDLNQIRFYCTKGAKDPFVQQMQQRVKAVEAQTKQTLDELFVRALEAQNQDFALSAIRAYGALAGQRQAEQIFRRVTVDPYLQLVVTPTKLATEGLETMYRNIVEFLRSCFLLVHPYPGFHFLIDAVWPSIQQHLEEKTPSIFAIGIANIFHRNCMLTLDFLLTLESLCHSPAEVHAFRRASEAFTKKWNASVYYEMRFHEIVTTLQATPFDLSSTSTPSPQPQKTPDALLTHDFSVPQVVATYTALHSCWDEQVFLSLVVDRFFALSLQIISHLRGWVDSLSPPTSSSQSSTTTPSTTTPASTTPSSSTPASSASSVPLTAADISSQQTIINICCEVLRFADYLSGKVALSSKASYLDTLRRLFTSPHLDSAAMLTAFETGTRTSAGHLRSTALQLVHRYLQHAIHGSVGELKALQGIAQFYRMMDRPRPTKESFYVSGVLKPVDRLLKQFRERGVSAADLDEWKYTAARQITREFVLLAQSFKETLSKQNTFNRIFRPASSSDDEKIDIQLYLDVLAYGRQLKEVLDIDPQTFDAFQLFQPLTEPGRLALQSKE